MRYSSLLLLATVVAVSPLAAQEEPSVVSGSRVRVWAERPPLSGLEGDVVAISPESLAVKPNYASASTGASRRRLGAPPVIRMPMYTVVRMDVRSPDRPRGQGAMRGAIRGGLLGLGVGLAATALTPGAFEGQGMSGLLWIIYPAAGLGTGTVAGAAYGAARPGGTWTSVSLPARTSSAGSDGIRLGVSLKL